MSEPPKSEPSTAHKAFSMLEQIHCLEVRVKQLAHEKSEADRAHNSAQRQLLNLRSEFTRLASPFIDRQTLANDPRAPRVGVIG